MPDEEPAANAARELAPDMLRYFLRRVDAAEDAADLLSDFFVVLCRRSADIPADPQDRRLWAYGVAGNVVRQHRRTSRRRGVLVTRLAGELREDAPIAADAPLLDDLRAALAKLAWVDREIIRLVHWEGLAQADAATVLGMPPATLRSRYLRARIALKETLAARP